MIMKLISRLFAVALLMCAVSVQAAKLLNGWSPTRGYNNSDTEARKDDGKTVTLKGIDRGPWIIFKTAPPIRPTTAGFKPLIQPLTTRLLRNLS